MAMTKYQKETWVWLALGLSIIILRLAVRVKTRGFRGFFMDDYLIILAGCLFATESSLAYTIGHYGTNNMRPEVRASLPPEMVERMVYGSKLLYGGWYVYFSLLWVLKWCMICFYGRLTLGLRQANTLRWVSWVVGITPIVIICTLIFNCWPVQKNWQVIPDPGVKCTQGWAYFAVTGLPNVLTETLLLLIPIPILFQVQISLRKKIPLTFLLSLGVFIILATILRHVAIFRDIYDARQVTIWATREAFTSIFVNCAAQLKPLYDWAYQKIFRTNITSRGTDRGDYAKRSHGYGAQSNHSHYSPSTVVLTDAEKQTSRRASDTSNDSGTMGGSAGLVINTKTSWVVTTSGDGVQLQDLESGRARGGAGSRSDSQNSQIIHSPRTAALRSKNTLPTYEVEVGRGS